MAGLEHLAQPALAQQIQHVIGAIAELSARPASSLIDLIDGEPAALAQRLGQARAPSPRPWET